MMFPFSAIEFDLEYGHDFDEWNHNIRGVIFTTLEENI